MLLSPTSRYYPSPVIPKLITKAEFCNIFLKLSLTKSVDEIYLSNTPVKSA